MEFDALSVEDYELGQAMLGYVPGSVASWNVSSYPDSIPSGTVPRNDNGFSFGGFTDALKSVSTSVIDTAKTIYSLENAANVASLQRIQTASAIDVAKSQASTARDVALAQQATEAVKAQAILASAQQSAKLNAQLAAGGSTDLFTFALLGFGIWFLVKKAGK